MKKVKLGKNATLTYYKRAEETLNIPGLIRDLKKEFGDKKQKSNKSK